MRTRPAARLTQFWKMCRPRMSWYCGTCASRSWTWREPYRGCRRKGRCKEALKARLISLPRFPTDVAVGYHLCYGTLPRWPMVELRTIGTQVTLANALIERSGRPIEVLHLVIPKSPTESFFNGSEDLKANGADLYLGLIHEDELY